MGRFIDGLTDVLKRSFNLKLWLYFFIIIFLSAIGYILIRLLTMDLPLNLVFASLGVQLSALTSPGTSVSPFEIINLLMANLPFIIAVYIISFTTYLILITLFSSVVTGVEMNLSNDFLTRNILSLGTALDKTMPRFFTLFKVQIIIGILEALFFIVLILPIIIAAMGQLPQLMTTMLIDPATFSAAIFNLIILATVAFAIFALVMFFLSPILVLMAPVALFENLGAIDSIRRAIQLGKRNYLNSLGYLILAGIIALAAVLLLAGIFIGLILLVLVPIAGGAPSPQAAGAAIIVILISILLLIIVMIPFILWLSAFSSLVVVKLYHLNAEGMPAARPAPVPPGIAPRPKKLEEQPWIKK